MLRRVAIYASNQAWARKLVMRTPVTRRIAMRFVGGADLGSGLAAVRGLNRMGAKATLNDLGEHSTTRAAAIEAADGAIQALDAIQREGVDSNISVKLTKLGLDVDEGLCREQLVRILDQARSATNFVRIDMEESRYTETTLRIFEEMLERYGEGTVGIVLQSYLRTHTANLERCIARGARVRLVKGGYREPADAYQEQAQIDAAFREDIEALLRRGNHPAIATHDADAIRWTRELKGTLGVDKRDLEFQMLYGIRRDLQRALIAESYIVRCYVPYGAPFMGYLLGSLRRSVDGARPFRARVVGSPPGENETGPQV